jgi:hypothetical protein
MRSFCHQTSNGALMGLAGIRGHLAAMCLLSTHQVAAWRAAAFICHTVAGTILLRCNVELADMCVELVSHRTDLAGHVWLVVCERTRVRVWVAKGLLSKNTFLRNGQGSLFAYDPQQQ